MIFKRVKLIRYLFIFIFIMFLVIDIIFLILTILNFLKRTNAIEVKDGKLIIYNY